MSINAINAVFTHTQHSGSALVMLLAIAQHATDDGTAWGHVSHFADKCRMTAGAAGKVISKLEESGELAVSSEPPFPGLNMRHMKKYRIAIMQGPAKQAKVKGGAA